MIKYLVYHYTGNNGNCTVANAKHYRDTVVQSSAHYFVDDTDVYLSVPDLGIAWAVGGKPQMSSGRLYGVVTNTNSISIEMCNTMRNGELMASEQTLAHASALGRELMQKYDIPPEDVVRHFDVMGKHCPAYFINNGKWLEFKTRLIVQEGDTEMTLG